MIATIPVKDEASAKRVERMKNFMRADQVAQLAVSLASPACKEVSGQIFTARGNEIFLMSQPRPVRGLGKIEGLDAGDHRRALHGGDEAELHRPGADHGHPRARSGGIRCSGRVAPLSSSPATAGDPVAADTMPG